MTSKEEIWLNSFKHADGVSNISTCAQLSMMSKLTAAIHTAKSKLVPIASFMMSLHHLIQNSLEQHKPLCSILLETFKELTILCLSTP